MPHIPQRLTAYTTNVAVTTSNGTQRKNQELYHYGNRKMFAEVFSVASAK
ncbi:MAG: hypothetical protein U0Y96_00545 [Candidatus Kapaibacterium sp.]